MFAIETFAVTIFFTVACFGLGSFFLQLKPFKDIKKIYKTNLRFTLVSYILGQGILSFVLNILAITGLFYSLFVFFLLFIPFVYAIFFFPKRIIRVFIEIRARANALLNLETGWGLIALLCIIFYVGTFTTFGRPMDGDSATIYMSVSKLLASTNQFIPLPGYVRVNYAGGYSENIYAAIISLGFRDSGRMNDLIIVLAITLLLFLIGKRLGIQKQGFWVILASLLTTSTFIYLICKGTADIYAIMLALASFFLLLPDNEDFQKQEYLLAGIVGGLTAYAKISYVLCFYPVILFFVIFRFFSTNSPNSLIKIWKTRAFTACLYLCAGILVGFSPLLIKDAVFFGNPLIGFLDGGSSYVGVNFQNSLIGSKLRAFPFDLFYGSFPTQHGRLSSLILAFFPLVFITGAFKKPFKSNLLVQTTLATLAGLLAWIIFFPSIFVLRYFLAPLLMLSFAPAYSVEFLFQNSKARLLKILIILAMALLLSSEISSQLNLMLFPKQTIDYLSGSLIECEKNQFFCKALKPINREAKPGDRVLFASWFNYHLRPDLLQCMVSEKDGEVFRLTPQSENPPINPFDFSPRPTFNDSWEKIYKRGFKYLVLIQNPDARAGKLDLELMRNTPWVNLVQLYYDEKISVYRIEYTSPPSKIQVECVETKPNVWELIEIN